MLQFAAGLARGSFRLLFSLLLLLPVSGAAPLAAADAPLRMHVLYGVSFNGFDIGSFEVDTEAEQQRYDLVASAHLSFLLGAYTWEGRTHSFGLIAKEATRPSAYSFDFKSTLKAGSTTLLFSDGAVTRISQLPAAIASPGAIPLNGDHLKGVLDPLSALLVLSRASANPCQRRIPIFDGRERFDLLFSYKGETRVTELTASGQPDVGVLCKVKYLPIAGHRVDATTEFMAASEEIEVALRPIPAANLFVPYRISVPTRVGTASLSSKRIEIASPGQPQIALLQ